MQLKLEIESSGGTDWTLYTNQESKTTIFELWNNNKVLPIECTNGSVVCLKSDQIKSIIQTEVKDG